VGVAGPAFAHDCFNPNKKPGAGSIGTITLDAQGNDVSADITKAHGASSPSTPAPWEFPE
jgi:hypothetical protein